MLLVHWSTNPFINAVTLRGLVLKLVVISYEKPRSSTSQYAALLKKLIRTSCLRAEKANIASVLRARTDVVLANLDRAILGQGLPKPHSLFFVAKKVQWSILMKASLRSLIEAHKQMYARPMQSSSAELPSSSPRSNRNSDDERSRKRRLNGSFDCDGGNSPELRDRGEEIQKMLAASDIDVKELSSLIDELSKKCDLNIRSILFRLVDRVQRESSLRKEQESKCAASECERALLEGSIKDFEERLTSLQAELRQARENYTTVFDHVSELAHKLTLTEADREALSKKMVDLEKMNTGLEKKNAELEALTHKYRQALDAIKSLADKSA